MSHVLYTHEAKLQELAGVDNLAAITSRAPDAAQSLASAIRRASEEIDEALECGGHASFVGGREIVGTTSVDDGGGTILISAVNIDGGDFESLTAGRARSMGSVVTMTDSYIVDLIIRAGGGDPPPSTSITITEGHDGGFDGTMTTPEGDATTVSKLIQAGTLLAFDNLTAGVDTDMTAGLNAEIARVRKWLEAVRAGTVCLTTFDGAKSTGAETLAFVPAECCTASRPDPCDAESWAKVVGL